MDDAIRFADLNGVKKLLLTHHDPLHSDEQLHEILNGLKEKNGTPVSFDMAVERTTINL